MAAAGWRESLGGSFELSARRDTQAVTHARLVGSVAVVHKPDRKFQWFFRGLGLAATSRPARISEIVSFWRQQDGPEDGYFPR